MLTNVDISRVTVTITIRLINSMVGIMVGNGGVCLVDKFSILVYNKNTKKEKGRGKLNAKNKIR